MMGHMPAIPESTRSSITLRLLDHAEKNWSQLAKVRTRYHGSFAYITGVLRNGQQIPLFRLRYGGSAHSFGFATLVRRAGGGTGDTHRYPFGRKMAFMPLGAGRP